MKKPIVAIMYDFDKTLSTTDMQDYGFIPALGMKPEEFWGATGEFTKKTGVERILSYMYMMIYLAKEKGVDISRKSLNKMGENITYYPGVETWFKRINKYGKSKGVQVEHYLISSGTKEIVEGCSIAKEFKEIYGCEFYYDPKTGEPVWPKLAINYTQKTQYFFRISKGATDINDDNKINQRTVNRRIPYENMIYLGDGMTDIPCMVVVRQNHGSAIAISKNNKSDTLKQLIKSGRVNFACTASYKEDSQLDQTVKMLIDRIAINSQIRDREEKLHKYALKLKEKDE